MASSFKGMNVEAVIGIAGNLNNAADQLEQLMQQISKLVQDAQANWHGTDSDQFAQEWNGTYKGQMTNLKTALNDLSNKAKQNAQRQADTSSQY